MKILLASDVHNEYHDDLVEFIEGLDKTANVLVLAGDIDSHDRIADTLGVFCRAYPQVVFVPGNHEFYGTSTTILHNSLTALQESISNLYYLHPDNPSVMIDGQHFLGSTLWYPDLPGNFRYRSGMSDFHKIQGFEPWVYEQNARFVENFLELATEETIVVSHHLPTYDAVQPYWRGSGLNRFFVSECKKEIEEKQPKAWLHGHSHTPAEVTIGRTKICLNPRGYPGEGPYVETDPLFSSNYVLDI